MDPRQDKIEKIQREINETKHLLQQNTNKIIDREANLEELEHKSANLMLNSNSFKRSAKFLKTDRCVGYYAPILIIMCLVTIFIVIIVSSVNRKKN